MDGYAINPNGISPNGSPTGENGVHTGSVVSPDVTVQSPPVGPILDSHIQPSVGQVEPEATIPGAEAVLPDKHVETMTTVPEQPQTVSVTTAETQVDNPDRKLSQEEVKSEGEKLIEEADKVLMELPEVKMAIRRGYMRQLAIKNLNPDQYSQEDYLQEFGLHQNVRIPTPDLMVEVTRLLHEENSIRYLNYLGIEIRRRDSTEMIDIETSEDRNPNERTIFYSGPKYNSNAMRSPMNTSGAANAIREVINELKTTIPSE